jgi:phosphatidylglycerophosphate synthase
MRGLVVKGKDMRDAVLRKDKDRLLQPIARRWFAHVHPNWISAAALGFGLTCALAAWQQHYLAALLLWAVNRILDGLDGVVAREHAKQSDFGGYLDLILDFIVYLAVPIAIAAAQPSIALLWATVTLISAFVLNLLSWSVLSAILEKRAATGAGSLTTVAMPGGLIEGAETIIFYTLFLLLPGYAALLFTVMAILVLVTAAQRVAWAARHL